MPRYRVYVIELDRAVMHIRAFRERNPDARADKPCVYVGSTWLEPQKRFEQHKAGVKANRFARKFGVKLRERLMKHLQSYETRALAMAAEVWGVVGVRICCGSETKQAVANVYLSRAFS